MDLKINSFIHKSIPAQVRKRENFNLNVKKFDLTIYMR